VLLAEGLPRMLHDLLVVLAKDSEGLEVVDTVLTLQELSERIHAAGPQIVVFRREQPGLPVWADELLRRHPRLRFLALDPEGRCGDQIETRLVLTRIAEISADALIAALHEPAPSTSRPTAAGRGGSRAAAERGRL
jgi:hypothetical protein